MELPSRVEDDLRDTPNSPSQGVGYPAAGLRNFVDRVMESIDKLAMIFGPSEIDTGFDLDDISYYPGTLEEAFETVGHYLYSAQKGVISEVSKSNSEIGESRIFYPPKERAMRAYANPLGEAIREAVLDSRDVLLIKVKDDETGEEIGRIRFSRRENESDESGEQQLRFRL